MPRTTYKKEPFLAAFRVCGSITEAAKAVGLRRENHYKWLRSDPEYARLYKLAQAAFSRGLRKNAVRRVAAQRIDAVRLAAAQRVDAFIRSIIA